MSICTCMCILNGKKWIFIICHYITLLYNLSTEI